MNSFPKLPFYISASFLLIGLYVFVTILSAGQYIVLPFIYATFIAIMISPAVDFLLKKKVNRTLSIIFVLCFFLLMVIGVIALISTQATRLGHSFPQLADKFQDLLSQSINWISGYFNISAVKINDWIAYEKSELINKSSTAIGVTLSTIGGIMATAFLSPVYIFMILFYQPHLIEFIHKLFGDGNKKNVSELLTETKSIIQRYLSGLFIEFVIISILNIVGLLLLGIEYALLLGVIGALLNIIPYIGGIIGVLIFMIIALVTKPPVYIIYVFLLYTLIQFVDNNLIVPKVVGSIVKLNALVSIISVIAGAALWGIPGMFISIPLIAIVKLVFDRIDPLKPWGFLLGDIRAPGNRSAG